MCIISQKASARGRVYFLVFRIFSSSQRKHHRDALNTNILWGWVEEEGDLKMMTWVEEEGDVKISVKISVKKTGHLTVLGERRRSLVIFTVIGERSALPF